MIPAVEAQINLQALRHNLNQVRLSAAQSKIMAVIKANGYGHGIVRVAKALTDADAFAVARLDEALELRQAGISQPIVLLEGLNSTDELEQIVSNQLQLVIHNHLQVDILESTLTSSPLTVWLKIDSGMHRMGFAPEAVKTVWQRLKECHSVVEIKLMTHLASADDRDSEQTNQQLASFEEAVNDLSGEKSIANSAGILGWPQSHAEWVRPGIMLYGVSPFIDGRGDEFDLQPVMILKSRLIAINHFKKGDAIGYGASWVCPEEMPIGVVSCGYGDGYPRHAVPGTPVLINGQRLPLVGRVSMDTICVDLRGQKNAKIGDAVTLWGDGLAVEEIAEQAGTIAYELLCRVTQRVNISVLD